MSQELRYPLGEHARDQVRTRTNRPLDELTLENVRAGTLHTGDFGIHPETLLAQAQVAQEKGFDHLAANFRRAAELASVPDDKVLAIYEALRPYRVTYEQLVALADELESAYDAHENARFIREAAEVYRQRGLL